MVGNGEREQTDGRGAAVNQSINQLGGEAISQRRSIRDRATPGGGMNFSGGIFLSADFPFSFSPAIPFYYSIRCDSISRFARRPLPPSSVVSIDARFLPAFFTLTRRKQMNLRVENLNGGKRVDERNIVSLTRLFLNTIPIYMKKKRDLKKIDIDICK